MNILAFILILMIYPFVLLMYFLLKNDATPKKNIYFGITLNKDQKKDEDVLHVVKEYNRRMKKYLWILLLSPIPLAFIPWFSVFLTLWLIWLLATCFAFFIPFGKANVKLKELKLLKGWNTSEPSKVYIELKSAGSLHRVKYYHFIPQNVLTLLTVLWCLSTYQGPHSFPIHLLTVSFAAVTPLFWLIAVLMDRQKTQIISTDSNININYNRAKKNIWKNFWSCCCWVNVVYMLSIPFALSPEGTLTTVFWITTMLYIVLTLILLILLLKKKEHLDSQYASEISEDFIDDDSHWIWGMIYYNPKDKHSMVEKRVGVGTTMNMATPVGKAFAIIGILSILSLPTLSIWVHLLEFTPIQLRISEEKLIATHLHNEYMIPLSSIKDAELLTQLPKMSKSHGTSMDHLKKGSFMIPDSGHCTVFANPENKLFIRLESFGTTYYLSGFDDEETAQIYETLH